MTLLRHFSLVVAASIVFLGCDSTDDPTQVTVNVSLTGTGSGSVESRTVGLNIECRLEDTNITGTCDSQFFDNRGGLVRLLAQPELTSTFEWKGDCADVDDALCVLEYTSDSDETFAIEAEFKAKTADVILTPPGAVITTAGAEGAVTFTARAVDEDGDEVIGVVYSWANSNPSVVSLDVAPNTREAVVTPVASGSAVITVMTQGVSRSAGIDVGI